MVYIYSAVVQAAFNTNSDSLAIEITAPSSTTIKIRKIRITHDDGTATVSADYYRKIKIVTESVAGTGGNSYTPITRDQNEPVSACTVKTALTAVGTVDKTIYINSVHSTTDYLWQASDDDDKIVVLPNGIFGIIVNPAQ
jgi:hypothetical protein